MCFCTKCGHQIHETAPACPGCGAPGPNVAQHSTPSVTQSAQTPFVGFIAICLGLASLIMPYFAAVFFAPAALICGVIALARRERKWVSFVGIGTALLGFIGIFAVSQLITSALSRGSLPQSPFAPAAIVTKSQYDQISDGMTYEQVASIIGHSGNEMSRSDLGGIDTVMYLWQNSNGSSMNAMFQNDRLESKAQFGLPSDPVQPSDSYRGPTSDTDAGPPSDYVPKWKKLPFNEWPKP